MVEQIDRQIYRYRHGTKLKVFGKLLKNFTDVSGKESFFPVTKFAKLLKGLGQRVIDPPNCVIR
jgi:hypothetical protein